MMGYVISALVALLGIFFVTATSKYETPVAQLTPEATTSVESIKEEVRARATTTVVTKPETTIPVVVKTAVPLRNKTASTTAPSASSSTPAQQQIAPQPIVVPKTPTGDVTHSIQYAYYKINGSTATELRTAMNQKRIDATGFAHDGYTDWYVGWKYTSKQYSGKCSIERIDISTTITATLPSWENSATAPESLRLAWQSYLEKLTLHEHGHRDIVQDGGKSLWSALAEHHQGDPSCASLDVAMHEISDRELERIKQKNKDYDALTDHGKTQGVIFP